MAGVCEVGTRDASVEEHRHEAIRDRAQAGTGDLMAVNNSGMVR